MPGDPIHHDVEGLFRVGDDLRDALLSHDLAGVRLHARQMAGVAALLGLGGVEAAALAMVECVRTDAPPARVQRCGTGLSALELQNERAHEAHEGREVDHPADPVGRPAVGPVTPIISVSFMRTEGRRNDRSYHASNNAPHRKSQLLGRRGSVTTRTSPARTKMAAMTFWAVGMLALLTGSSSSIRSPPILRSTRGARPLSHSGHRPYPSRRPQVLANSCWVNQVACRRRRFRSRCGTAAAHTMGCHFRRGRPDPSATPRTGPRCPWAFGAGVPRAALRSFREPGGRSPRDTWPIARRTTAPWLHCQPEHPGNGRTARPERPPPATALRASTGRGQRSPPPTGQSWGRPGSWAWSI